MHERSSGYSRRPLVDKLGIKAGHRVVLVNAPRGFARTLGRLPPGVKLVTRQQGGATLIVAFAKSCRAVDEGFRRWKKALASDGSLWVCWPKRSSTFAGDLDENALRETGLRGGLVDVKVCAVDQDWSGLKFVYRLKDRAPQDPKVAAPF